MPDPSPITRSLHQVRAGEDGAFERLIDLVYDDLRRIASHHLERNAAHRTLSPTGLVHEAYLRLADPRSPALGGHLNNFGRLAFDQGRYAAAEEWLRDAVDILADAEGPDLRHGAALTNLGQVALAQGDAEAAEEHLLAGRTVFAQLYGDPSPYTAISDGYLGKVFAAAGRRAEATARFESSRSVLAQHLPAMTERLVFVETWQAVMLREAGEREAAAGLLDGAVLRARDLPETSRARTEAEAAKQLTP